MGNLYRRYQASPEECFGALAERLEVLEAAVTALSEAGRHLEELLGSVVKAAASRPGAPGPAAGWSYDAARPNLYFADLYGADTVDRDNAPAGRWVGPSGVVAARLALPRTVQYDFAVRTVDFALPEYARTFHLRVDNRRYEWLRTGDRSYETIILEHAGASDLGFELGVVVSPDAKPDLTFAFFRIEIRRRG